MDDNKAKNNIDKQQVEDMKDGRPDEVFQLMSKSMDFVKELMAENEKLRYRVVQIQQENKGLVEKAGSGGRAEMLKEKIN